MFKDVWIKVLLSQCFYPIKICSYDDKNYKSPQNHMTPFPLKFRPPFLGLTLESDRSLSEYEDITGCFALNIS